MASGAQRWRVWSWCRNGFPRAGRRQAKCAFVQRRMIQHETSIGKLWPQPSPWSHPHMLSCDEVTPLVTKDEYRERRASVVRAADKLVGGSQAVLVIVVSAAKRYMSEKIPHVYRQNSDFFYLTGCTEPDAVLVLASKPGGGSFEEVLFYPRSDLQAEIWEGPQLDLNVCLNLLGVSNANNLSNLSHYLSRFFAENSRNGVHIWKDPNRAFEDVERALGQAVSGSASDLAMVTHQLRLYKSKSEQELMKKSCSIICSSVIETIAVTKPLMCESQLWATVDYHSRMKGAQYLAYPPVVASGTRANTIHYTDNNQLVKDGEMILMDAGCQYHGYSSDLTRCWPVNGRFTEPQKVVYEALLDVQLDLIKFCEELPPLDVLFQKMCYLLGRNLKELGFGNSKCNSINDKAQMAYTFCPHHVSHYLGIDVHDTGKVKRSVPLEPGMIITIEPGLYVDLNREMAPKDFHGIGLRIEDDVLITESGVQVLTASCPKTVADIEGVMQRCSN